MRRLSDEKDLVAAGLNLVAVFDLAALPNGLHTALALAHDLTPYRQIILVGHGGRSMWQALHKCGMDGADPVDELSRSAVARALGASGHCDALEFLYPGDTAGVSLIEMGKLAGWHYQTPFGIGIHPVWGCWFAYRALVLADSDFTPEADKQMPGPCATCVEKPCVTACPAGAVAQTGDFKAPACFDYRLAEGSVCASLCLARSACPVGRDHAYGADQQAYHAGRSLKMLQQYRDNGAC